MVPKRPVCAAPERRAPNQVKSWAQTAGGDHFVQFYRTDDYLIDCLAGYFAEGLLAGESGLVLATSAHAAALGARLKTKRVDLRTEQGRSRFVALDAEEVVRRILRRGELDAAAFREIVVPVLDGFPADRPLRCFGELVALLWTKGNRVAALELENVWNELYTLREFRLFCAYPVSCVERNDDQGGLDAICRTHAHVISLPV